MLFVECCLCRISSIGRTSTTYCREKKILLSFGVKVFLFIYVRWLGKEGQKMAGGGGRVKVVDGWKALRKIYLMAGACGGGG